MADEATLFTEVLLGERPVHIRRRVIWGDCDPAGVVYSPRFADYAVTAVLWFVRRVLRPHLPENLGTPLKGMRFEFHHTLATDELFDMRVGLIAVRHRTFDLEVKATDVAGAPRFTAVMTPILVDRETFTSVPITAEVRRVLDQYRDASA